MMQQSLLSLLLLTIVALSSTNELPLIQNKDLDEILNVQIIGSTLKNRHNKDRNINIKPILSNVIYDEDNNSDDILNDHLSKEYIPDEDIVTKEHWHNYGSRYIPMQEKLRKALEENTVGTLTNERQTNEINDINESDENKLIELLLNNKNEIVTVSPLLILKIRLSFLKNGLMDGERKHGYTNMLPLDSESKSEYNKILESQNQLIKRKRDDETLEDESYQSTDLSAGINKNMVKKRIFSLWSRMQGLHRGHELHHRRHLHAFYGVPDDGGGGGGMKSHGTLTAETRATFIRPPGSPLRWG